MKIGILTFHNGFNCGAYLQTLYLSKALENLGHEPIIVNYESTAAKKREIMHLFSSRHPKFFFQNIIKYIRFKKSRRQFKMTKRFTEMDNILSGVNISAVILGSDEIWNYNNVISGLDLTYFGSGLDHIPKIAYAPSFGDVNHDEIIPDKITKHLREIKCLSVRDVNSSRLLSKQGIQAKIVCDPTLLKDSPIVSCYKKQPFILVYATNLSELLVKKIRAFAKANKLKIKCISYRIKGLSSDISVGPTQFEMLFAQSSYIVTNTLHGTLFSIKNKKKFCLIYDEYRKNKLQSIVEDFKILYLTKKNIDQFERIITMELNYDWINAKIQLLRAESIKYLIKGISSVRE